MRCDQADKPDHAGDRNEGGDQHRADKEHQCAKRLDPQPHRSGIFIPHHQHVEPGSTVGKHRDAGCRPDRGKQEGFPLGCRKASHLPVVDRCDAFRALCQEDQKAGDRTHHRIDRSSGEQEGHRLQPSAACGLGDKIDRTGCSGCPCKCG